MMKFLELGHLRPGDLVWRAGFSEWRPASTVFDLARKTVISGRKTEAEPQPVAPQPATASAVATPAVVPTAAAVPTAASSPDPVVADNAAKTGIGLKRPLDTPLLSPAQLPKSAPVTKPEPILATASLAEAGGGDVPVTSPAVTSQAVTSLNERLQKAAFERAAGDDTTSPATGPTHPLHKTWPSELQAPATVPATVPTPAASAAVVQASGPAKLQPLPELRVPNPVPLMPLGPRHVAPVTAPVTAADSDDPKGKRKKVPRPDLAIAANAEPSRGHARSLGIGLTLAIIVGGGGWLAYSSRGAITSVVSKSTVTTASQANPAATPPAPAKPPAAAEPPAKIAVAASAATDSPGKTTPFVTAAKTVESIDADLKRAAVWQLIAGEFPEWHRDRVAELAKLAAEKRDPTAISRHIAEALVSLRRKFADQALSASPERLRAVAVAFLENLRQLSAHSTDACYGFISQGETYPAVIDLMRQGDKTEALHKQSVAVFEAVAFGRKTPQTNLPPRKADYDALAAELTARGWSQSDLQMFSDAKALAAAPPEQVCKMVQDWFAAQIAIKDPAVQLRLLIESLRPVVAG
jgi:hypothetical protein